MVNIKNISATANNEDQVQIEINNKVHLMRINSTECDTFVYPELFFAVLNQYTTGIYISSK
jgi:hypothetical protein